MEKTTYYGLNLVQGTDVVNPLTNDVPNFRKIDEVMHDNAVAGVTLATEITNGTIHALVRNNAECAVIRFIATSEWKMGDSVTVDGVPVTALLPSGETLPNGAYVINANVLCILTGTNLTVYAERKKDIVANEVGYKNTNVEQELNNISTNIETLNRSNVWEDITNSCQWNIEINTTGQYRSRLMYNRETGHLFGSIETIGDTKISNQKIICTLPDYVANTYAGMCGLATFVSEASGFNVTPRIIDRHIISSHTLDREIYHAEYHINCFVN